MSMSPEQIKKFLQDFGVEKSTSNFKPHPESDEEEEDNPLTESQNAVKNNILSALKAGTKKIVLSGSAGTGKTFMVQYLIKEFRKFNKKGKISITAPTNRAVSVLMEKQPDAPYYMDFSTIHKALFLKRFINDKTGDVSFRPDYNPKRERPFDHCSLIIVDEASMLNSELLYYLELSDYAHIPMIFLGDNKQLNPVQEQDSPVFLRKNLSGQTIKILLSDGKTATHVVPYYEEFTLTEIIRQGHNNPIIDLSYNLPRISLLEDNLTTDGEGYYYSGDFNHCIDILAKNTDSRYLAWTNAEIDKVNKIVRNKLYTNPNKVELGETIIFSEPYEGADHVYWTNYELEIKNLEVKTSTFRPVMNFRYEDDGIQSLNIEQELTFYWINKDVKIIHESSMTDFMDVSRRIKHMIAKHGMSWKVHYAFVEGFVRFGYRYALTVHKSQGGTFNQVIINMKNLNYNKNIPERNRLWYTALTRAAHKVTIFNPPYND